MRKLILKYPAECVALKAYLLLNMEINVQMTDKKKRDNSSMLPSENHNIFPFLNYAIIFEIITVKNQNP